MSRFFYLVLIFLIFSYLALPGKPYADPVVTIIPSQPGIEKKSTGQDKPEVDILISLIEPFENSYAGMDGPQLFLGKRFFRTENGTLEEENLNLLGHVEEINYMDNKAFGVNVSLENPGLYQFVLESKPWWNEEEKKFLQQQARVILPVLGIDAGWEKSADQAFEILPLTRPFGLVAPALFSGIVLTDNKPSANTLVRMSRINFDKQTAPTQWHKSQTAITDTEGKFSFLLDKAGWWACEAVRAGAPLKGPDGNKYPLTVSTILWLYVDPAQTPKK